jgi:hypothetical protein
MRVTTHRRSAVTATALATAAATLLWLPGTAQAATACGTYYGGGRYDGYSAPAVADIEGVYAKIVTHTPALCPQNPGISNSVTATVSLGDSGGSYPRYAQAGYWRQTPTGSLRFYSQWNAGDGAGYVATVGSTVGVGTTNAYTVKWIASCSCLGLYANAAQLDSTPFNPFSAWSYPFDAHFFGSATYDQSDMPGTSSAKTRFSMIQVQDLATDAWRATGIGTYSSSTPGNALGRWAKSAMTQNGTYGNNFEIWTP